MFKINFPLATLLRLMALISVMLGLGLALLYQPRSVSGIHKHTYATFQRLEGVPVSDVIHDIWSPRVASIELSYGFVGLIDKLFRFTGSTLPFIKHVQYAVAIWTAGWFSAICIMFIVAFQWKSLLYMLGTFAGMSFGYTLDSRIYSWDMPALFSYSVAVTLLATKRMTWVRVVCVSAIIVTAIPFKETSILLCIFPLFICTQYSVPRRVLLTAAIALVATCVKLAINYSVTGSFFSFATQSFYDDSTLLMWNVRQFFKEPIILANAGTIFAMLVTPVWRRDVLMYKSISILFIAGAFLFGVTNEYRIWFEMLPLSLFTLDVAMNNGQHLIGSTTPEQECGP